MWWPRTRLEQFPAVRQFPKVGHSVKSRIHRLPWLALVELSVLALWSARVAWPYLDLNPTTIPTGVEFGMGIQPQFIWTLFTQCGECVFWNGFVNGGNPSFVELHGVVLHPLTIITTVLWGGLNGTKIALVGIFFMAGFAQWWLARVLGLGCIARTWSAGLAISGGHLAGRMSLGVIGIMLSTAACSLILAPMLDLTLHGRRRSAVLLGIVSALAIVSGQGYLQLGVVLGIVPATLIFVYSSSKRRPFLKEFLHAGVLSVMLAGVFLIPLLHFWPNFAKEVDPTFGSIQPLEYLPLNLVIRDPTFYTDENILFKQPYPYLYLAYISWVPVLLLVAAARLVPRRDFAVLMYLFGLVGALYVVSSLGTADVRTRLASTVAATIRNPTLIVGLAVPIILAIAAWGLDRLLQLSWPRLLIQPSTTKLATPNYAVSLVWLLAVPLLWSLLSTFTFSQHWIRTAPEGVEVKGVLDKLQPTTTQWVEPPFGEHYWTPSALAHGLKLTTITRPWHWKDRQEPLPYLRASRHAADISDPGYRDTVHDILILSYPERRYATIDNGAQPVPCDAHALGGNIDVVCTSDTPGQLIVQENMWTGWYAQRDGQSIPLKGGPWLHVDAPAGVHHYTFRYRPWDVYAGLCLTLAGILLCLWHWFGTTITTVFPRQVPQLPNKVADDSEGTA